MDELFDSAWLKWGWAVVHAQALQTDLAENFATVDPNRLYTTRTEYDPKSHCIIVRVDTLQPPPTRWGLRLGDVANNFRASLDHLAWTLVTRTPTFAALTPRQKERLHIYFPYADSAESFRSKVIGNLPGVSRADKAIIRRYQPYIGGKRKLLRHPLTPLPKLNTDDKHREIRPVWSAPEMGKLEIRDPRDCEITKVPPLKEIVLKLDAEICRVYVRKTGPNPDLYVHASLSIKPIVDGPIWLDSWLIETTAHISALLREFAEPPEEILALGIIPAPQGEPVP